MNDRWMKTYQLALIVSYKNPSLLLNSRGDEIDRREWAGSEADASEDYLRKREKEEERRFNERLKIKYDAEKISS